MESSHPMSFGAARLHDRYDPFIQVYFLSARHAREQYHTKRALLFAASTVMLFVLVGG